MSRVSETIRELVRETLAAEVDANIKALQTAIETAAYYSRHPIRDKAVSLVVQGESADLVQWTSVTEKKGRKVAIDHMNRVKSIVAYAVPIQCFSEARVFIHEVPVVMARVTPTLRDTVPAWCMLLWAHCQDQFFSGPLVSPARRRGCAYECVVCYAVRKREGLVLPLEQDCVFSCKVCATLWHSECAKYVLADPDVCLNPFVCPHCVATETRAVT